MRKCIAVLMVVLSSCAIVWAADWLNDRGDAKRTGCQTREKILSPANVQGLKLIWKRKLDNDSKGPNSLTPPVIFGHLITYRGTKELVIAGGSSDNVFAVDADLGTLFWTRHLDAPAPTCGGGLSAAPAIAPPPPGTEDAEDDDAPQTLRPIYAIASDGRVHALRPSTGEDLSAPVQFLPPGAKAFGLNLVNGVLSAETSDGCGVRKGVWSMDTSSPAAKPRFETGAHDDSRAICGDSTYAVSGNTVAAFRGEKQVWKSREIARPGSPVAANGVVYVLSTGSASTHAVLHALDAATGKELYSSGDEVKSFVDSSAPAVANGHVCFGTHDNTLYCFGFPVDR